MPKIVAFDSETGGLDWWLPEQQAFLVTWADEHGSYHARYDDDEAMAAFFETVRQADILVGHNLPFDVHQVRETFGVDLLAGNYRIADTNILARLVYPAGAGGYGNYRLKALSVKHLADDADDGEQLIKAYAREHKIKLKDVGGYRAVWDDSPEGEELMEFYARKDAAITRELYLHLIDQLPPEREALWDIEMDTMRVLIEAERVGVATDQARVVDLKREYTAQQRELYETLSQELGDEALGGAGSDAALREALQMIGIPLHRTTPTGELSVNQFALQEFADDEPIVGQLLEYRRVSKFLSTYIGALEGNEVVHTSFHQCDAWTGRMSSSRPNMQNLPSRAGTEIRSVFVPRPGMCFVVYDYESIEVRLLAYYLNDPDFAAKIEAGWDPHAWMASQIWGGDEADYVKGSPGEKKRGLAKAALFAITYGAGGGRLADMLLAAGERMTTQHVQRNGPPWCDCDACKMAFKIKSALPGYWDLAGRRDSRVRTKVQMDGYVTTLMGRKQVVDKHKAYVGLNALIQGSAADVMKQGLVNVATAVKPYGATPLLVVHDEVVIECPIEHADACAAAVEQAMVAAADISPRLSVSGAVVTTSYADAK
jgi:DNA polymerase I